MKDIYPSLVLLSRAIAVSLFCMYFLKGFSLLQVVKEAWSRSLPVC